MATTEAIRDKNNLKRLADYWLKRGNYRNYALIVLAVYTALRISDLLSLTWADVFSNESGEFKTHITLTEGKTGKAKKIALNTKAVKALKLLHPHSRGIFIFSNNRKNEKPISREQAWRIINAAAEAVGVQGASPHALRKTFGYHAWVGEVNPVLIMDIYNHSSFEVTRRYLGIAQDDRDEVYLKADLL